MILTQCPVCAASLPDLTAKQCSRCKTRYCGPACQEQHWKAGGHDKLCKKIRKGGGAEQYHANSRYTEAVAVAVEKCADDTKGQTCYICTEAVHPRTGEGLVRMCACGDRDGVASGSTGVAHVSCLAEQAKILFAEAEENNLDHKWAERWSRWYTCGLCEQRHHGVVLCALGWACWKTYLGRPEADWARQCAMNVLGNGLGTAGHHEEALSVKEAELSMARRCSAGSEASILTTQSNLASTYEALGRPEALQMQRDVYTGYLRLKGEGHEETLSAANNYAASLNTVRRFEESKGFLRKTIPVALRVLGESNELTLKMRLIYAQTLYGDYSATLDDLHEAVTTHEDLERIARRVLGGTHPDVAGIAGSLRFARLALATRKGTKIK